MPKRAAQPDSEVQATSSTPLELPKEQEALFHEILALFEAERLRFAVAGAFALRQHTGICRFTKDLDIFLSPQTATKALALLQHRGFRCEICDPVWLAKVHRKEYFIDLITGMSNAVIGVDDSWIDRAHPARVCGVDTRVLAPEEVIASKLFVTRRERFDGADIAHLIFASKGELQWARVFHLAGDHWELVFWSLILFRYVYPAYTDYVPNALWRDLIARFSRVIESDSSEERFRGSLIDDVMFAIDVDEWGLANLLAEQRDRRTKIRPSLRRV